MLLVLIPVENFERAVTFYGGVLGLHCPLAAPPSMAFVM